jgi:KTSC domain
MQRKLNQAVASEKTPPMPRNPEPKRRLPRYCGMPSKAIADIEYDPERKWLTVTFVNGQVYRYDAVPPEVCAAFQSASSKGEYFNFNIRDQYRHWEIPATILNADADS